MTRTLDQWKTETAALPPEDRAALAEHLLESPEDEAAEAALVKEWNRRIEEMRSDPTCARPVEEFLAELRELYP